ncbi:alpha/beta hydrolase [Cryobacterium sp. CG_9.6]|uniref:alpha/beta hydrolase n=1 Tax=Cryobacterium sp. CG_9.6 TaxID=2760710 RepID=UPI0024738EC0|nr:alpha/beta hydrolase [Cryobacterium sp. CG_9.6]MDH6238149.1 uncharacterized membrane protein YhaH (DUF805 family) [Cryobacterium sp. CG_9.6]
MDASLTRADRIFFWVTRVVSAIGVLVTVVAAVATGSMIVHGHPAYVILLAVTVVVSAVVALRSWRTTTITRQKHRVVRGILAGASLAVIALLGWLVPASAEQPALSAMNSDAAVTVTETADRIVLTPTQTPSTVGVFFQPGARVDARAYAAVLKPLAEAGHTVIIPKQPLGIAFLATQAFTATRDTVPAVTQWVLGGHSLGGTVAAIDADAYANDASEPAVGLLFYASYPATDLSAMPAEVLSISGSTDGLATVDKIAASKTDLPADSTFLVIEGGNHAYFGDYGAQRGDGEPTISHDAQRTQISEASVAFVTSLAE